jgi:hypothetical protein
LTITRVPAVILKVNLSRGGLASSMTRLSELASRTVPSWMME